MRLRALLIADDPATTKTWFQFSFWVDSGAAVPQPVVMVGRASIRPSSPQHGLRSLSVGLARAPGRARDCLPSQGRLTRPAGNLVGEIARPPLLSTPSDIKMARCQPLNHTLLPV